MEYNFPATLVVAMDQAVLKKLDARARFDLPRGEIKGAVNVLIRTSAPLDSEQRAELIRAGGIVRTAVGNVLSATVNATSIESVARLPFVRKIELSQALFNE